MILSKRRSIFRMICITVLFSGTAMLWGNTAMIFAKAYLAKLLVAQAWHDTLSDQKNHKPWAWADTWPVAKLYFPKQRLTRYVLSGAHGGSLAFGPGLMDGTALPENRGTMVIGGHRDTHFAFLEKIKLGEIFLLQDKKKRWQYYRFERKIIRDIRHGPWFIDKQKNEVHLITCYPFDAVAPGGPLRLVVIATPIFGEQERTISSTRKVDGAPEGLMELERKTLSSEFSAKQIQQPRVHF